MGYAMKGLLVVAHGSRLAESNDEVRKLTDRLRERLAGRFSWVACAFLELAEPAIPEAIDVCVRNGAKMIVILPYFLAAGRHVVKDIPGVVEAKRSEYPNVRFQITPHLGAVEGLSEVMAAILWPEKPLNPRS